MGPQGQTELITLLVVVLVVARFLVRELRARTVRLSRLWIRPAFLGLLTAVLVVVTLKAPVAAGIPLLPSLSGGLIVGVVVGFLVALSTRVEATGQPDLVRLRGSWVTVAIWLAALALRMTARFIASGSALAASPAVNSGTLLLVAAAFTVFAIIVGRRARQATT